MPLFLPINVAVAVCPYALTDKLQIMGHSYTVQCIAYGSGGHFVSNFRIGGTWYLYDGLKEYHRKQTGLTKQAKPVPRTGYIRNNVIFVRDTIY